MIGGFFGAAVAYIGYDTLKVSTAPVQPGMISTLWLIGKTYFSKDRKLLGCALSKEGHTFEDMGDSEDGYPRRQCSKCNRCDINKLDHNSMMSDESFSYFWERERNNETD